ncbi:acyl-CoA dehydrogenase [Xylophilus sp. Kf1]|nr:acyl-CoA dehydrogenase [Xylophilus sp. Kf1]
MSDQESKPFARDLARLRRHAPSADAAGWLQPAQQAVMHRRGWLTLLAPRAAGGAEWPLPRLVRLEAAVAAADGSCGWVLTLCAGAGWFAGFLPPALARAVILTRRACLAGSGAPSGFADRADGGWRLSGEWSYASGAPMATHFTLNAVLRQGGQPLRDDAGTPRVQAFVVPAAQVTRQPGWFAIGMRASGSHGFRLDGTRVADDHAFAIDPDAATAPGPLYRFDFLSLAWVTLAANLAGMARHFVALADPLVRQRRPLRADRPMGDDAGVRHRLAQADRQLAGAWQALLAALDDAWAGVDAGGRLSAPHQAGLRDRSRAVAEAARFAVDGLYPLCGMHAADQRSELNRVWRDFHTASQHALFVT